MPGAQHANAAPIQAPASTQLASHYRYQSGPAVLSATYISRTHLLHSALLACKGRQTSARFLAAPQPAFRIQTGTVLINAADIRTSGTCAAARFLQLCGRQGQQPQTTAGNTARCIASVSERLPAGIIDPARIESSSHIKDPGTVTADSVLHCADRVANAATCVVTPAVLRTVAAQPIPTRAVAPVP